MEHCSTVGLWSVSKVWLVNNATITTTPEVNEKNRDDNSSNDFFVIFMTVLF